MNFVQGDATEPRGDGARIIVHVCNDVGGWGRGFVVALSRRWPAPEDEYRRWYRERSRSNFGLGAVQLVEVEPQIWVANLVGQHGVTRTAEGPPVRYDAIETGLRTVADQASVLGASLHMPRIGCGLAGGEWSEIEPILTRAVVQQGVAVTVYDLFDRAGANEGA